MKIRLDESNIIDYLHNFNKNFIRETKHSNNRRKSRELSIKIIRELLTEKNPN